MKKFFIAFTRLVLVLAIVVVIDFAVGKLDGFVFIHENQVNPDYITKVSTCNDDILIIGSSTARHHYIPQRIQDSLGLSVYNAGFDGTFFIIQNCVINHLLDYTTPHFIIWEIGEDCLSDNMSLSREYQHMDILYHYYEEPYIQDAVNKRDKWQNFRMLSNMYRDNSNIVHDFLMLVNLICQKSLNVGIDKNDLRGYNPLPNEGYQYPEIANVSIAEFVNSNRCEMLINTLHKCKNHDVKVIFTSSPRHYRPDVLLTKQFKELCRIAQQETIPYLIYYQYDGISNVNDYFKDCDHLNAKGTEAYMSVFIPSLKQALWELDKVDPKNQLVKP